jgi:hypothetical protein
MQESKPDSWNKCYQYSLALRLSQKKVYMKKARPSLLLAFGVADPQKFNADLYPLIHLNADPDPTFHFNVDPDLAPHQSDDNLRPQYY